MCEHPNEKLQGFGNGTTCGVKCKACGKVFADLAAVAADRPKKKKEVKTDERV